jgi:tetratricopeptide (TPR) repeat protein
LLPLAIAVSKQMIDTCEDKEEQALLLNNLSNRLGQSGEREQGLEAIRRAVAIYEQLAEQNFAAYAPDLALSLNNLSIRQAESGDIDNALSNIERAVELIKPFAKPGTRYADRQQEMQSQLARLKGK